MGAKMHVRRKVTFVQSEKPKWQVECPTCDSGGFFSGFLGAAVIVTHDLADAIWWANWHAAEHQRTACKCCGHMPDIPPIRVLDANTLRVGDRLFARKGNGWSEVEMPDYATTAAPTPTPRADEAQERGRHE